jgi:phospholipase D1/2
VSKLQLGQRIDLVDNVEIWSHHEKVVVVDNHRACIGGLDICFGRWDTQNHPLADAHPTDFSRTLFPGQDYNNARITDFQDVSSYVSETISVLESPRMPWQDVSLLLYSFPQRRLTHRFRST